MITRVRVEARGETKEFLLEELSRGASYARDWHFSSDLAEPETSEPVVQSSKNGFWGYIWIERKDFVEPTPS